MRARYDADKLSTDFAAALFGEPIERIRSGLAVNGFRERMQRMERISGQRIRGTD